MLLSLKTIFNLFRLISQLSISSPTFKKKNQFLCFWKLQLSQLSAFRGPERPEPFGTHLTEFLAEQVLREYGGRSQERGPGRTWKVYCHVHHLVAHVLLFIFERSCLSHTHLARDHGGSFFQAFWIYQWRILDLPMEVAWFELTSKSETPLTTRNHEIRHDSYLQEAARTAFGRNATVNSFGSFLQGTFLEGLAQSKRTARVGLWLHEISEASTNSQVLIWTYTSAAESMIPDQIIQRRQGLGILKKKIQHLRNTAILQSSSLSACQCWLSY